ncbi:hypothetical protein ES703_27049 [subsurface metagenome]
MGNPVLFHKLPGKGLITLQAGCGSAGPEDPQSLLFEAIHDAGTERNLRPHYGQVNRRLPGKSSQAGKMLSARYIDCLIQRRARVTRRRNNLFHPGAAGQEHGQGMLPAPASHHQNICHFFLLPLLKPETDPLQAFRPAAKSLPRFEPAVTGAYSRQYRAGSAGTLSNPLPS